VSKIILGGRMGYSWMSARLEEGQLREYTHRREDEASLEDRTLVKRVRGTVRGRPRRVRGKVREGAEKVDVTRRAAK
jgi:hypothetical protein